MQQQPSQPAIRCDNCGYSEQLPVFVLCGTYCEQELERLVPLLFYSIKRTLASLGWYTSVGCDLCPTCCEVLGVRPGYVESGLLPRVQRDPRNN